MKYYFYVNMKPRFLLNSSKDLKLKNYIKIKENVYKIGHYMFAYHANYGMIDLIPI